MTRRKLREHLFKLVYLGAFNGDEEMPRQIDMYFDEDHSTDGEGEEPVSEEEFEHSLSEFAELAKACEMNPVDTVTQSLAHVNTGLYVGAGKADEIRIGAGHIPMITVYNKADLCDPPVAYPVSGSVEQTVDGISNVNLYLCAKDSRSIDCLCKTIFEILHAERTVRTFLIPYDRGSLVSFLMERSVVLQTEYTAEGTKITVECDTATAEQVEKAMR